MSTKTIAETLDQEGRDGEDDLLKAGGVVVGDGRSKDSPWYRFPDGSAVWKCDQCGRPIFDFGWGCCLPD